MCLQEVKIPKWKEKEELVKKGSFDDALEALGVNEEFFDKKKKEDTAEVEEETENVGL